MPWDDPNFCQVPGQPPPNGDAVAVSVTSSASHEITEAFAGPLLNAWLTNAGDEIGDLCAYNYGTNAWDAGAAN
ncbi:MAG: hypothetical protein ACRECP_11800 [Methylocella sp.]